MDNVIYHRASLETRMEEILTFPIVRPETGEKTECMVRVPLLVLYPTFREFPCADGASAVLSNEQLLELLYKVKEAQTEMASSSPKTLKAWEDSGLDLVEFVSVGDIVDEDIVNYFLNVLPPIVNYRNLLQVSEPFSSEACESGGCKNTYLTFHKEADGNWHFCGACFPYEHVNRADMRPKIDRVLDKIAKGEIC